MTKVELLRIRKIMACLFVAMVQVAAQVPAISSFAPANGPVGTVVTVVGSGFGTTPAQNAVYFGGAKGQVTSGDADTVKATVPSGATYAFISVTNLTTGKTGYSSGPFTLTFNALRGIDSTSFSPRINFATGSSPRGLAIGDIDTDGKPDIVVIESGTSIISIFRNISTSGVITFAAPSITQVGRYPQSLALGDLDGDGRLDIAVSDSGNNYVKILRNTSAPGTFNLGLPDSFLVGGKAIGIAIGDIDGDGQPDVVTTNYQTNNVSVLRNTSAALITFATKVDLTVGSLPFDVALQDFNGDFLPEIVVSNSGTTTLSVLQNASSPGTVSYGAAFSLTAGTTPRGLAIADLDGDGKRDIVFANQGSNNISLVRNIVSAFSLSSSSFSGKVDVAAGSTPYDVAIADLDGDGKPDIAVTNASVDSVAVLRNTTASGSFTSGSMAGKVQFSAGTTPYSIGSADLDGDGKPDLVATNTSSNSFSAFRNKAVKTETEPNNTASQSNALSAGETVRGLISTPTDVDYFRFTATAGDTLEYYGSPANGSTLISWVSIIDSIGGYVISGNNYFPSPTNPHSIFIASRTGPYFVRYTYAYNFSTSYPNAPGVEKPKMAPSSAAQLVTNDTGSYQLRFERFTPSAPEVAAYPYTFLTFHNAVRVSVTIAPNGLSTNVEFEYGPTQSLGSSAAADQNPFPPGIGRPEATATLPGLLPNTQYYVRAKVTNSAGTVYTQINSIYTPPQPQGWVRQPSGTNQGLYGTAFSSSTSGFAVGYVNTIAQTTNGGNSWSLTTPAGYGWAFRSVAVFSNRGIAVGYNNEVLRTTDGGTSWQETTDFAAVNGGFYRVAMLNLNNAVTVGSGGRIDRSTDGGATWTNPRYGASDLYGVSFAFGTNTGFAVGDNGTILHTSNAGASWDSIPSGTSTYLLAVSFLDATTGIVVGGGGLIRRTTDGGSSWTDVPSNTYNELWDISFTDASNGVIVGTGGVILRTSDSGASWTLQESGTTANLYGVSYVGRSVTAVGDYGVILNYLDPTSEVEDNNSTANAQLIAFRDEVNASILPAADIDYFKFSMVAGDTIELSVVSIDSLIVNSTLQLISTNGTTVLATNDDFIPGDTSQSRIVYAIAAPGTYYAKLTANSSSATGNYRIRLQRGTMRPLIPFGGVGTILTLTDVVLKAPVIPNNLATTITFQYGTTTSYGSNVAADQSGSSGQQLINATKTIGGLTPFTEYHFRVVASNAVGTTQGPDVTFTTALGMLRAEVEANNTASLANTIFIGDTVQGDISSQTDVDYFRFQAAAGDTLEVYAYRRNASTLDSRIDVIDSTYSNTFISNNYLPDRGAPHSVFVAPTTGVYFLRYGYAYYYNYYPNGPNKDIPRAKTLPSPESPLRTALSSSPNGDYEFRLKRFSPSKPDVQEFVYTAVTNATSTIVTGVICPNGLATTAIVEYGTTSSYGNSVPAFGSPLTGVSVQNFNVSLTGLLPATTYYFRVVATNAMGTSTSGQGSFTTAPAADGWVFQGTQTQGDLYDVAFLNDTVGVVVGGSRVLKTSNGGGTWTPTATSGAYSYGIAYAGRDTVVAVGYGFQRSTNGGSNWTYIYPNPIGGGFWKVRFAGPDLGGSVGFDGKIIRTTNAGSAWEVVGSGYGYLYGLHFVNRDTVFVAGSAGSILRTYNFTAPSPSWTSLNSGTLAWLYSVAFMDKDTGVVAGEGVIRRTTDGGETWTGVTPPISTTFNGVAFKNTLDGVIVGANGLIMRSNDAGATWTAQQSGTESYLYSVFYGGRSATAIGDYSTILRYTDPLGEVESNNSLAQAMLLRYNDQLDGSIGSAGDVDYYKFTAAASDTVEVYVANRGGSILNGKIELRNASDAVIAGALNDDYVQGDPTQSRVVQVIASPGTYYIRYEGANGTTTGQYRLRLQKTSLKPVLTGSASTSILTPTSVTLNAVVDPNNLSTSVKFYWGTSITYSDSTAPVFISGQQRQTVSRNLLSLTPYTDYHFKVVAQNGAGSVSGLDVGFRTPLAGALPEAEPNNDTSLAQVVFLGDSVDGRVASNTDVDYYKFHAEAGDTIDVFVSPRGSSTLVSYVLIYQEDGNTLEGNNYFPNATTPHILTVLPYSGNYFLKETYAYNFSSSFPTQVGDERAEMQKLPPASMMTRVDVDSGEYRIYIRKFKPSKPDVYDYPSTNSLFHDRALVYSTIRSNGKPTNAAFEYGPTISLGSSVPGIGNPFSEFYSENPTGIITGLPANSSIYFRATASNNLGTSTSQTSSFSTPPAPEGWTYFPTNSPFSVNGIFVIDQAKAISVGNSGTVYRTTNGGTTWSTVSTGFFNTLTSVWFMNGATGIASGSGGMILKTTDGGINWNTRSSGTTTFLRKVVFANGTLGVSVGNNGTITRTTDGGETWNVVRAGGNTLLGVSFGNASSAFAVGANGVILHSTDAGVTWDSLATTGTTNALFGVKFFSPTKGFVVGLGNLIRKTTDAGTSWSVVTSPASASFLDIAFTDTTNGVIVGSSGTILRTYDGGQTWSKQESGTYNQLSSVSFTGRTAAASGNGGTIMTSVGILPVPGSLTATNDSLNYVDVSWTYSPTGQQGFLVERKTGSAGTYALRTIAGANATSVSDTVQLGRIYYYRVRAYNSVDTSSYSASDSALVPLAVPTNLDAVTAGASRIDLSWLNVSDGRDGYKVERKIGAGGTWGEVTTLGSGSSSYQDQALAAATRYYYRVRSYNADMNSGYSNEDSAKTALGKPSGIALAPTGVTNQPITISWSSPSGALFAYYLVDVSPPNSGGSLGSQRPVNGNSFLLSTPPVGSHWIYFYLEDDEGNKDPLVFDSVQTRFDNVLPAITDQTPTPLPTVNIASGAVTSPSLIAITANVTKPSGIAGLRIPTLEYRKTQSLTTNSLSFPATNGGSASIINLPSLFLTLGNANGGEYRIRATDSAGNVAVSSWKSFDVFVSTGTPSAMVPPAAGTTTNTDQLLRNYRIWSVPLDLQNKQPAAFMEDGTNGLGPHAKGGVNYYNWRMQQIPLGGGTPIDYESFKGNPVLTPGAAFFLIARDPRPITVGAGSIVKASDMQGTGIQLLQGWNLVGNPFQADLTVDSLSVVSGTIQQKAYFKGDGPQSGWVVDTAEARTLRSWGGLAIRVSQNTFLRFKTLPSQTGETPPPAPQSPSAEMASQSDQGGGWLMRFDARRTDFDVEDLGNMIGMVPGAKTEYDAYDAFQPPIIPGSGVALYFTSPEGELSNDIRPVSGTGAVWEMKVIGKPESKVHLDIQSIVPSSDPAMRAYLLDLDERMAFDVLQQRTVEFNTKLGSRNFRVVAGSRQFVDSVSATAGIDLLPKSMTLFQNYPNPFNPETVIRFTVPGNLATYKVSLKIYNIIGQQIATLIEGDILPGYYERTFDARGLASGTYVYRLVISGGSKESTHSDVRKMLLIK